MMPGARLLAFPAAGIGLLLSLDVPRAEAPGAAPGTSFEWTLAAPVVVAGTSLGQDGRHFDFVVSWVARGDVQIGATIRVDVREANRERDRILDPKARRLDEGSGYALLLEPLPSEAGKPPRFGLVRGVDGVLPLPAEGREIWLAALERFVDIQNAGSEAVKWAALDEMLGETSPMLLSAALEQFLKFRRGRSEQVPALPPLLDHPQTEIRAQAARLAEQIIERRGSAGDILPDEDELRRALVARARRDPSIPVRVAATEALAAFRDDAADQVLREIAANDPEQAVRYAAEVQLLERAAARSPAEKGEGEAR